MYSDVELEIPQHVKFYQFVVEEYNFCDKSNVMKVSSRTVRNDTEVQYN